MWLCSLSVIAQTDGYDPANPPLPDFPQDDPQETRYTLVVASSPNGSGSLNTTGGQYAEGTSVYLYAYNHDGFYFQYWIDDEGNTLSTNRSMYYTMPNRDAVVTAVYRYSPDDPSLPDFPEESGPTYTLKLDTKPAGAGSFNTNSVSLTENQSIHIYAYTNSNFYFKHWEDAEGNVISTAQNFYYQMPARDTQLYAIYYYNPSNPSNPGKNFYDSFTGEVIIDDFDRGNLSGAIYDVTKGNTSNITSITVAGVINGNDFSIANNYRTCSIVDLSRTNGVSIVPSYCYYENTNLNRLSLPASITLIESYAFYSATALTELTIHATVPPALNWNVFDGVTPGLVVYVPAKSIELYENAERWKEYVDNGTIVIMPIASQVSSLEVNLPEECADGRYKNMPLELLNVKTGQKYKYVVTDRINYTFSNLVNGTSYVASLKNLSGAVLAKTDTINIQEDNVSVTFDIAEMKQLRTLSASVKNSEGTDVTSSCTFTWYDANGTFLIQGNSLAGQVSETTVRCAVVLPQSLAMEYVQPADSLYEVVEGDNEVVFTLEALPKAQLTGRILDVTTQQPIANAVVTVSQTLNGKYSKSFSAKTDNKGAYAMTVFAVPASVTYAANDYVSQTAELSDNIFVTADIALADVKLKPITGATITTNFTYTQSVAATVQPGVQNYYSDYNNVAYNIYNVTAQKEVKEFNVQYPNIVLLEEVNEDDSLSITATSKNGAFMDITVGGHINEALRMDVTIPVVQLGGIDATFTTTENSKVLGILYDSKGTFVSKYNYGSSTLSIRELKDGEYTLVTMGASDFFGSIYNLEKFAEAGLKQNIDYLVNKVTVKSGLIAPLKNVLVPFFDESKFYYTGDNTSFTVNKTSIVAGNYLTLTAKVDFKEVYKSSISDVCLNVELPEGTTMVDNSVMVGSSVVYYDLNGRTLTVPLNNNVASDRVRFCVVPTKSGSYAPNAEVSFKLGDKAVSQPMGSAAYVVKDISIVAPSTVSKKEFSISGTATGRASVAIYDDMNLLGETTALANGFWSATVELDDPYNLSTHNIYAKITTTNGVAMQTPTKEVVYDENTIEVSKVTMFHWNPETNTNYEVLFDFQNSNNKPGSYVYYIYNKKFTFTVDFTQNDPERIEDVVLVVKTGKGNKVSLNAVYSEKQNRWIAEGEFGNMYDGDIPVNVAVKYNLQTDCVLDNRLWDDARNTLISESESLKSESADIDQILDSIDDIDNAYSAIEVLAAAGLIENNDIDDDFHELTLEELQAWADNYDDSEDTDESLLPIINMKDALVSLLAIQQNATIDIDENTHLNVSTLEGKDLTNLEEQGFVSVSLPSGQTLYVLYSDDKTIIIDTADNLYIETIHEAGAENAARNFIKGASGIDNFNEWIEKIRSFYDPIRQAYEDLQEMIGDLVAHVESDLATAIEQEKKYRTQFKRYTTLVEKTEARLASGELDPWQINEQQAKLASYQKSLKKFKGLYKTAVKARKLSDKMLPIVKRLSPQLKKVCPLLKYADAVAKGVKIINDYARLYYKVPNPCRDDQEEADACRLEALSGGKWAFGLFAAKLGVDALLDLSVAANAVSAPATGGVTLLTGFGIAVTKMIISIAIDAAFDRFNKSKQKAIKAHIKKLKCYNKDDDDDDDDDSDDNTHESGNDDATNTIDPSGYVYEGVSSNRLQGVTATAYYKETVEDMYGDLHENIVLWNAEDYAQKNPLFTDENGMYQWDVPEGMWQVRFEKEGYVPAQSEWLPVPPPQLDVNIGMVQNAQPEVVAARAYDDGVELEFSKYMDIESLNNENIFVKVVNGEDEQFITNAEITMLNSEVTIEGNTTQYASKMKLATDQLGYYDEAYIIVSTGVNSYAGIPMAHTYEQKLDVEQKVREILVDDEFNVEYSGQKVITVAAIPAEAAAGKKLTIASASEMIATTDVKEVTLDADGQATFTVNGELYGATALNISLADADLKATTLINVVDPSKLEAVKRPMASRISGTAVYRGQTVALSCESEGAVIYYTTDGSCPCDEATRIKYERPLAINDAMTLKFMAVGANHDESDVVECIYSIRQSNVKLNLAEGWNWSSHDVAAPIDINELSGIASVVMTQTEEVIDDPILGFIGTLTSVDASETMKIKAKENALKDFTGEQYNPGLSPISLHAGWNWLGYPINQTMTVGDALTYMDAEEGDCLSNLDGGFATFTDGSWAGSLEVMSPGAGYLYKSASSKSFIYNDLPTVQNAKALYGHRLELKSAPWSVNKHRYPSMMPVIAQVCYNDGEASDSTYYVAAFAGDECRGIGKYADGIIYLSVYGDKAAELTFKACNEDTGYVHDFAETITFAPDVVGTPAAPFMLKLGGEPNGINTISTCNGTDGIYNLQGVKVNSVSGSGIYIIKSTDKHGNSVIQKSYVK